MFAHTVQKYIPCAVGSPARFFTWVTPLPTEFLFFRFDFVTFGLFSNIENSIFSRKSVYRTPTGFNIFLSLAFFVVVFRLGIILWWSWSIFRERRKRVGRSCVGDTRSRRGPPDSLVQWGRSISRMIIFDHFYPNQSSRTNRTSTIGHEYEMVT